MNLLPKRLAPPGDVVCQHREVIRDDQVILFIRPEPVRHCARLWARSVFVIRYFRQGAGSLRTLPPDLGIGRRGAALPTVLRLRVGLRHRIISRTGRAHERGNPLEMRGCFAPSCGRRGALEERRRPFGDPFYVKRPVSEGRMALPTPFETKRKKAPIGALGRIQYLNVADGKGFEPSRRFPAYTLSRRAPSTTRPPLRISVCRASTRPCRPLSRRSPCRQSWWRSTKIPRSGSGGTIAKTLLLATAIRSFDDIILTSLTHRSQLAIATGFSGLYVTGSGIAAGVG